MERNKGHASGSFAAGGSRQSTPACPDLPVSGRRPLIGSRTRARPPRPRRDLLFGTRADRRRRLGLVSTLICAFRDFIRCPSPSEPRPWSSVPPWPRALRTPSCLSPQPPRPPWALPPASVCPLFSPRLLLPGPGDFQGMVSSPFHHTTFPASPPPTWCVRHPRLAPAEPCVFLVISPPRCLLTACLPD